MQNHGGRIQGHWRAGHPLYGWLYGWIVGFLLPVAQSGFTWKEKIVGFLHDAIEDTDYTTEALFRRIEDTLRKLSTSEDEAWKEEFDIMPFPGDSMYFPSENDWQEMGEALDRKSVV